MDCKPWLLAAAALPPAVLGEEEPEFTDHFPLDECRFVAWGGNAYFSLRPGRRSHFSNGYCVSGGECDELEATVVYGSDRHGDLEEDDDQAVARKEGTR